MSQPKVRCRFLEFDPQHLCRAGSLLVREYDAALLLFSAERVLQNQSLFRAGHVGCQTEQRAIERLQPRCAWPQRRMAPAFARL